MSNEFTNLSDAPEGTTSQPASSPNWIDELFPFKAVADKPWKQADAPAVVQQAKQADTRISNVDGAPENFLAYNDVYLGLSQFAKDAGARNNGPGAAQNEFARGLHAFFQNDIEANGKFDHNTYSKNDAYAGLHTFYQDDILKNKGGKGENFRNYNDVYAGMHTFWQEDVMQHLKGEHGKATDNFRNFNDVYMGLHTFWVQDVLPQLMKDKPPGTEFTPEEVLKALRRPK